MNSVMQTYTVMCNRMSVVFTGYASDVSHMRNDVHG